MSPTKENQFERGTFSSLQFRLFQTRNVPRKRPTARPQGQLPRKNEEALKNFLGRGIYNLMKKNAGEGTFRQLHSTARPSEARVCSFGAALVKVLLNPRIH